MEAQANPVKRQYARREVSTEDMPVGQKAEIDIGNLVNFIRNESLPDTGERPLLPDYLAALAFAEEPVTISIEENSRSDFPETHVFVQASGNGAEMWINNQWATVTWLPIGQVITTKRKYLEILMRSKSDHIRTQHDDATVQVPRNTLQRRTSGLYPVTIIEDKNPLGYEWASRIRAEH
jgi:hypothetical protein